MDYGFISDFNGGEFVGTFFWKIIAEDKSKRIQNRKSN